MWVDSQIVMEDLEVFSNLDYLQWEKLRNKRILITGATGLIGSTLLKALMYVNKSKNLKLSLVALVRDKDKAESKFCDILRDTKELSFIVGQVEDLPDNIGKIDYIIHGASPTASDYFMKRPVETIKTAIIGTMNLLELAKEKQVDGMVYLSSMEIYGSPRNEEKLSEKDVGYIDPLVVRNCYPEAKRQCEAMCVAYANEYSVPVMSARLAQTFGPGVDSQDKRVFAEFARCAMQGKDIELLTDGSSKRCYLYTMDAVSGILTILLKGTSGNAYNVANEDTYCSIYEMAQEVAKNFANDTISVEILNDSEAQKKYPPAHFLNLDVKALIQLGWKPTKTLMEMYGRMIHQME